MGQQRGEKLESERREEGEKKGSKACEDIGLSLQGRKLLLVASQQETPTHLLHNQAVTVKCQQSALVQMTSL